MVREEIYSPFKYLYFAWVKMNIERDIFILAGVMLKVMYILNIRSKIRRLLLKFNLKFNINSISFI